VKRNWFAFADERASFLSNRGLSVDGEEHKVHVKRHLSPPQPYWAVSGTSSQRGAN
jgi:hypothetical protein